MVSDQHDERLGLDREPLVMGTGASEALLDYCKADFRVRCPFELIEVRPG